MKRIPIIERAYELARSGSCRSMNELRQQLAAEDYMMVAEIISGQTLLEHLSSLMTDQHAAKREQGIA